MCGGGDDGGGVRLCGGGDDEGGVRLCVCVCVCACVMVSMVLAGLAYNCVQNPAPISRVFQQPASMEEKLSFFSFFSFLFL